MALHAPASIAELIELRQVELIRDHLATIHADHVQVFDTLVQRASTQHERKPAGEAPYQGAPHPPAHAGRLARRYTFSGPI